MNTPPLQTRKHAGLAGHLSALALMAALCPTASAEEELGRLFLTPERRQNLDHQRQHNIKEKQEITIPQDPTLTINGVVTRSSGKRTVWINGVAQNENEKQSGITVTPRGQEPGRVVVKATDAPAGNASVGDTVNRNTGESTDLLNGGSINVRRASPAQPLPGR